VIEYGWRFFSQPELDMPEEEMSQHTGHHMMNPAGKFSPLIVVHAKFSLRFLKTLLHSPANTAEPHEELEAALKPALLMK